MTRCHAMHFCLPRVLERKIKICLPFVVGGIVVAGAGVGAGVELSGVGVELIDVGRVAFDVNMEFGPPSNIGVGFNVSIEPFVDAGEVVAVGFVLYETIADSFV